MSGVAVVWYLLKTNSPVLALVPAARIMAGTPPIDTVLPTIGVTQISSIQRLTLAMNESPKLHTDRVQVSVLVKSPDSSPSGLGYPGMRSLLRLCLAACPNQRGTINGVAVDSILPDIEGPDLPNDAAGILQGSRDLIVKWRSS